MTVEWSNEGKGKASIPYPMITLHSTGLIKINTAAWRLFGEHKYIVFGYDKELHLIILKPAKIDDAGARKITLTGKRGKYGFISATIFRRKFGLMNIPPISLLARFENGMLITKIPDELLRCENGNKA